MKREKEPARFRKIQFMLNSCRTVRLLAVLEPFFDMNGVLTFEEIAEIINNNNIEFTNTPALRMYIHRLLKHGILSKPGYGKYSLELDKVEREILHQIAKICDEEGEEQ